MKTYSAKARELRLLIYKYAKGQLTMEEKQQLDEFMNRSPENASLVELLTSPEGPAQLLERQAHLEAVWKGHSFQTILNKIKQKRRRPFRQWHLIILLLMLLLVGSAYFVILLLSEQ
jgi:hypothetical protein